MSRKNAREDAFKIIFEVEISKNSIDDTLAYYFSLEDTNEADEWTVFAPGKNDKAFIEQETRGAIFHKEEIDALIAQNAKGWDLKRMSKVSLAVLRLCIFEMLYMDDIPVSVSINEAVELCKKYDAPELSGFVNGILGAVAKTL